MSPLDQRTSLRLLIAITLITLIGVCAAKRLRVERRVYTTPGTENFTDSSNQEQPSREVGGAVGTGGGGSRPHYGQESAEEIYWLGYAQITTRPDLTRDAIVQRPTCRHTDECATFQSACEQGRCGCPDGYYPKQLVGPRSSHQAARHQDQQPTTHPSAFCMRAVGYGEPCVATQQCVVNNSICAEPPGHWTSSELGAHGLTKLCLCRDGYFPGCKYLKDVSSSSQFVLPALRNLATFARVSCCC